MLLEKCPVEMKALIPGLLPVLLKSLLDESIVAVLLNLKVLTRISLQKHEIALVLNNILALFSTDWRLLETRGSLIVRKLCVLSNAKSVYIQMAGILGRSKKHSLEFISTMMQTLNLILLSATELHKKKV